MYTYIYIYVYYIYIYTHRKSAKQRVRRCRCVRMESADKHNIDIVCRFLFFPCGGVYSIPSYIRTCSWEVIEWATKWLVNEGSWMVNKQLGVFYAMHVGDLIIQMVGWMRVQMARWWLLGWQMKWIIVMRTLFACSVSELYLAVSGHFKQVQLDMKDLNDAHLIMVWHVLHRESNSCWRRRTDISCLLHPDDPYGFVFSMMPEPPQWRCFALMATAAHIFLKAAFQEMKDRHQTAKQNVRCKCDH